MQREHASNQAPPTAPRTQPPIAASRRPARSASGTCHLRVAWQRAHAGAVPIDQLHPVRTLGSEDIDRTRERIGLHRLAHQRGQTFCSFAEVDRLRCHQHPDRTGRPDHAPPFNARRTAATALASAPWPTRTITPSISTSMTLAAASWRGLRGLPRCATPSRQRILDHCRHELRRFGFAPVMADCRACRHIRKHLLRRP